MFKRADIYLYIDQIFSEIFYEQRISMVHMIWNKEDEFLKTDYVTLDVHVQQGMERLCCSI